MLTRCPACSTAYRVSADHLELAGGQVRCGRCGNLFSARLVRALPTAAFPDPEPAPPPPEAEPPAAAPVPRRRGATLAWTLASLALALGLAVQVLWWQRHELTHPLAVSAVQTLCQWVPCPDRPSQAPDRLEILSRHLEPDPNHPGQILFHLKMASRAAQPQPYPGLELRLFDHKEQLVGVRRLTPKEYLPSTFDPAAALQPNSPLELSLSLREPERGAVGFQIEFL